MVAGHLFIFRGDLTKVACDAWLLPTDFGFRVEDYWLSPEPEGFHAAMSALREVPVQGWLDGDLLAIPVPNWPERRSPPWLVNILSHKRGSLGRSVRAFAQEYLRRSKRIRNDRAKPLLALPVISTGKGGGAKIKGQVIETLVRDLLKIVQEFDLDIALVTRSAAALAAAQKARKEIEGTWVSLPDELVEKARDLARVGGKQGLALFLGAGVSCSAGLPSWTGLLEEMAKRIGIEGSELEEFSKLDMLDRGSVLEGRYRNRGTSIKLSIAELFKKNPDHSLLHGLLACLPANEVITQNYDQLFELAAVGSGNPVSTLPYSQPQDSPGRWLLKMHGCVSAPDDIVIRREDYLRYSERRAALSGIVQATLLTRRMLFVGFSLRDGNFHRAVDDVRRSMIHRQGYHFGTALFLYHSALTAELWQSEMEIIHFQGEDDMQAAARRLEIFIDCVLGHWGSNTSHLLDPSFSHLLNTAEDELKQQLLILARTVSNEAQATPAWGKVRRLLRSLGWSESEH